MRKNLSRTRGEQVLFDEVRYFFYITTRPTGPTWLSPLCMEPQILVRDDATSQSRPAGLSPHGFRRFVTAIIVIPAHVTRRARSVTVRLIGCLDRMFSAWRTIERTGFT